MLKSVAEQLLARAEISSEPWDSHDVDGEQIFMPQTLKIFTMKVRFLSRASLTSVRPSIFSIRRTRFSGYYALC